jgi:hypothetical protein
MLLSLFSIKFIKERLDDKVRISIYRLIFLLLI